MAILFMRIDSFLCLYQGFGFSHEEYGTSSQWDVPNCLHSHLKTIELKGNWEDYVEKVSYFLKNAKVLEKMTVKADSNEAFKNIMINCEDLLNPRRGSMVYSDRIIVISFVQRFCLLGRTYGLTKSYNMQVICFYHVIFTLNTND